jgi:hypothetical protein
VRVTIDMARRKSESRILIDGCEVTRGILDFGVDLRYGYPTVTLTIWPEHLTITGDLGEVIKLDLRRRKMAHTWKALVLRVGQIFYRYKRVGIKALETARFRGGK